MDEATRARLTASIEEFLTRYSAAFESGTRDDLEQLGDLDDATLQAVLNVTATWPGARIADAMLGTPTETTGSARRSGP